MEDILHQLIDVVNSMIYIALDVSTGAGFLNEPYHLHSFAVVLCQLDEPAGHIPAPKEEDMKRLLGQRINICMQIIEDLS